MPLSTEPRNKPDKQVRFRLSNKNISTELPICASHIAHKVSKGKTDDIKPEYIEEIIKMIQDVRNGTQQWPKADLKTLLAIQRQCYAAQIFYFEKNDPANYIATVEDKVLPNLEALLSFKL